MESGCNNYQCWCYYVILLFAAISYACSPFRGIVLQFSFILFWDHFSSLDLIYGTGLFATIIPRSYCFNKEIIPNESARFMLIQHRSKLCQTYETLHLFIVARPYLPVSRFSCSYYSYYEYHSALRWSNGDDAYRHMPTAPVWRSPSWKRYQTDNTKV